MKPLAQRMPLGRQCLAPHPYQRGSIMPMIIIALVAMIGIAGLVTDFAPLYWDKNKLQNAVDAAVLAAEEHLRLNQNDNANAITQAKLVFAKQKPTGAADLQDGNINIQTVDNKPVVTITGVSVSRASALTRVLPGAKQSYGVTVKAKAILRPNKTTTWACVSPLVICPATAGGTYQVRTTPYVFQVGSTAGVLCKDTNNDGVWDQSCNPSSTDENVAEGNYTMSGSDIESYCYDPTKTVKKGLGNGNVRKGVNARFFDENDLPGGWGTVSSLGNRDLYAYPFNNTGKTITKDKNDGSYGQLAYATYKSRTDVNTNLDVFGQSSNNPTTKFRRVLYVAQLPFGRCNQGDQSIDMNQVKVWCMFLRQPVDNDDNIYGEIFQDCSDLATQGHTKQVESTRLAQ